MDQRGYSVDPSETATPFTTAFPAARLQAWAGIAARSQMIDSIPVQRETAA